MRRLFFPLLLVLGGACAASGDADEATPNDAGTAKDSGKKDGTASVDSGGDPSTEDSGTAKDSAVKDSSVKDSSKPDSSTKPDTSTPPVDSGQPLSDAGSAPPGTTLIINEIDYDQLNLDAAEFVEIFNPTAAPIDATGYQLVFYNGALKGVVEYLRIPLTGTVPAGGYLVVGASSLTVDPAALKVNFSAASNNIQNGDPDGVVLFDGSGTKLDSVSYGGMMPGVSEGTAFSGVDSNSIDGSIIRSPNGADTNDNAADWKFTTTKTAGAMNTFTP